MVAPRAKLRAIGLGALVVVACLGGATTLSAQDKSSPLMLTEPVLPKLLTERDAVTIFRTRGLDLLIADAAVVGAQGDLQSASQIQNPNAYVQAGPTLNYNASPPCSGCEPYYLQWGLSDNGAVIDFVSGKRGLRSGAARNALSAAKLGRIDAQRNLESQVKQQYVQVVFAQATLEFSIQVQASLTQSLDLAKARYPGAIDEGALARVQIQKLEADQAVDSAKLALRQARVGLGFLLGVRSVTPDFEVEKALLAFRVPASLQKADERQLVQLAIAQRPDLQAQLAQQHRAADSLSLAQRNQLPDIALTMQYSQLGQGQNVGQPMSVVFGLQMNLPVFYQQQGEIRKARADVDTQALQHAKTGAQVSADVTSAFAAFKANREMVERMQTGGLLDRAKVARDIVEFQYRAGSASLIDFLDAQRTYISTNMEYLQDLSSYWTAIYQLEQAVGAELP